MSLTLEQWDNVSSILSNAITATTIILGAIFGRNKINEFLNTKKKEQAFNAAINLNKSIDELWTLYGKLTVSTNEIMTLLMTTPSEKIGKVEFYEVQKKYQKTTEDFSYFFSCHIALRHYNVHIKNEAMSTLLRKNGKIAMAAGEFFKLALRYINTIEQPIPTLEEVKTAYDKLAEEKLSAGPIISAVKAIKFEDMYGFSKK
ncbi:hypothetical protein ACUNI3_21725 [Serratia sp. IR-2025]|uniref:hypothetical protein n=1 Tax=Serratia nevei TaxID=2703794 RepID=UPI002AA0DF0E|nr:hypothetical protein [Serratia nevei]